MARFVRRGRAEGRDAFRTFGISSFIAVIFWLSQGRVALPNVRSLVSVSQRLWQ